MNHCQYHTSNIISEMINILGFVFRGVHADKNLARQMFERYL
jgi:hypothetical protein